MRIYLLTLLPLCLARLAVCFSTPNRTVSNDPESLAARNEDSLVNSFAGNQKNGWGWGNGGHHHGGGGAQCRGNPLRDQNDHCHCKHGLIELLGNCCCGDQPNTLLTLQGCGGDTGCDKPVCECTPAHSRTCCDVSDSCSSRHIQSETLAEM